LFALPFLCVSSVYAQDVAGVNTSVAQYVNISSPDLQDGDIIVLENSTYRKSNKISDSKIVGVYIKNPTVGVNYDETVNSKAIISNGVILVRVSGENGSITKNDQITTSSVPGVGMKANAGSTIIGSSLVNYAPSNIKNVQLIPVLSTNALGQQSTSVKRTIFDIFTLSNSVITEAPSTVFKYVVAAIVIILSFILSFFTFSRIATNGISALGRNPMASNKITAVILLNVCITISIIAGGIFVAYLIILF
jgi:hypothetical protein